MLSSETTLGRDALARIRCTATITRQGFTDALATDTMHGLALVITDALATDNRQGRCWSSVFVYGLFLCSLHLIARAHARTHEEGWHWLGMPLFRHLARAVITGGSNAIGRGGACVVSLRRVFA